MEVFCSTTGGSGKPPPYVPLLVFSRGKPRSHESSFSPFFADYIFGSQIMESSEMKVSRWFHHSCIEWSTSLRVIPSLPPGAKKQAIFLLCLLERKCNLTDILDSLRRSKIVPGDINRQQHCCLLAAFYLVSVPGLVYRWFLPFIWFFVSVFLSYLFPFLFLSWCSSFSFTFHISHFITSLSLHPHIYSHLLANLL